MPRTVPTDHLTQFRIPVGAAKATVAFRADHLPRLACAEGPPTARFPGLWLRLKLQKDAIPSQNQIAVRRLQLSAVNCPQDDCLKPHKLGGGPPASRHHRTFRTETSIRTHQAAGKSIDSPISGQLPADRRLIESVKTSFKVRRQGLCLPIYLHSGQLPAPGIIRRSLAATRPKQLKKHQAQPALCRSARTLHDL